MIDTAKQYGGSMDNIVYFLEATAEHPDRRGSCLGKTAKTHEHAMVCCSPDTPDTPVQSCMSQEVLTEHPEGLEGMEQPVQSIWT